MMRAIRHRLILGAVAGALCVPAAIGQDNAPPGGGRGGQGRPAGQQRAPRVELTPAQREAAWKLEVEGVASGLDLSKEAKEKIVEIYIDARNKHGEATLKLMEEMREQFRSREGGGGEGGGAGGGGGRGGAGGVGGGAGREMMQKVNDLTESSRKELNTKLDELLDGDDLKHAEQTLGSFNPGWDGMVHEIAGFGLADDAKFIVLWAVESYIIDFGKARESMADDREVAMTKMRESAEKLREAVKGILSEDQQRSLQRAGAGGFGFGGRGPGGGGGI